MLDIIFKEIYDKGNVYKPIKDFTSLKKMERYTLVDEDTFMIGPNGVKLHFKIFEPCGDIITFDNKIKEHRILINFNRI